jgi:hypothetical protein
MLTSFFFDLETFLFSNLVAIIMLTVLRKNNWDNKWIHKNLKKQRQGKTH